MFRARSFVGLAVVAMCSAACGAEASGEPADPEVHVEPCDSASTDKATNGVKNVACAGVEDTIAPAGGSFGSSWYVCPPSQPNLHCNAFGHCYCSAY